MNKTQSQLLELFKSSDTLILDRKRCNFEITAQDLGYLTGYTGVEYSLFERPKTWVVTRRTGAEFKLSMNIVSSPDIMRYNWACHTHLGIGLVSLLASEDDYAFLRQFRKKRSIICNSDGKCLNFGFADLKRGVYTTMLPPELKLIVLNNIQLIRFCSLSCIDMDKLRQCRVECFDEAYYVFTLGKPASKWPDGYVIIDDVNTRPDIVLIMRIENGEFIFETTDKTYLVEGKRQP